MTDFELFLLFCVALGSIITWVVAAGILYTTAKTVKRVRELTDLVITLDRDLATVEALIPRRDK